jgi:hypothetical protein
MNTHETSRVIRIGADFFADSQLPPFCIVAENEREDVLPDLSARNILG